jgi:hypothetical protein
MKVSNWIARHNLTGHIVQGSLDQHTIKDALFNEPLAEQYYLDWLTNSLTVESYAAYYNVKESYALAVIELGRWINNH